MALHNKLEIKEGGQPWTATEETYSKCSLKNGNIAVISDLGIEIRSGIDGSLIIPPQEMGFAADGYSFAVYGTQIFNADAYIFCVKMLGSFAIFNADNLNLIASGQVKDSLMAINAIKLPRTPTSFAIIDLSGRLNHILDLSNPSAPIIKPRFLTRTGRRPDSFVVLSSGRILLRDNSHIEEFKEESSASVPLMDIPEIADNKIVKLTSLARNHLAVLWRSEDGEVSGRVYNMTNQKPVAELKFKDTSPGKRIPKFGVSSMFDQTVLAIEGCGSAHTVFLWELATKKQCAYSFGSDVQILGDTIVQKGPSFIIYNPAQFKKLFLEAISTVLPPELSQISIECLSGFSFFCKDEKPDTHASGAAITALSHKSEPKYRVFGNRSNASD